jgi:hypothetical protein
VGLLLVEEKRWFLAQNPSTEAGYGWEDHYVMDATQISRDDGYVDRKESGAEPGRSNPGIGPGLLKIPWSLAGNIWRLRKGGEMMVLIVDAENWNLFKEYAEHCRVGTYQIKDTVEGKEVTIQAGRFAIKMEFSDLKDPGQKEQFDELLEFCALNSFFEITGSINDEILFA